MKRRYAVLLAVLVAVLLAAGNMGVASRSKAGGEDELSGLKKELSDLQEAFAKFKQSNTRNEGLISNLSRTSPPVGAVMAFAGAWPPKDAKGKEWTESELGWMLADGRELEAASHAELIAVLGTNQLPNYCGLFLRGIDSKFDGSLAGRDKDGKRSENHVQDWATGRPRNPFDTDENSGKHKHTGLWDAPGDDSKIPRWFFNDRDANFWRNNSSRKGTRPALVDMQEMPEANGGHEHRISRGGDLETRPINAAVHWIIKFK